jgi:hypothetical protein
MKKKGSKKKLVLAKETLRLMTDMELTRAATGSNACGTFVYSICSCDNSLVVDCPDPSVETKQTCGTDGW